MPPTKSKKQTKSLPREDSFSSQIRSIVRARSESPYSLARRAGIDPAALLRFLSGERGLVTPSVDKLFAALNLKLVERSRPKSPSASPVVPASGSGVDGELPHVVQLDDGRLDVEPLGGGLLESA